MLKRRLMIIGFVLGCLIFSGCSDGVVTSKSVSESIFAMDTYMTVTAYGNEAQNAVTEAIAEIERLDELLSVENKQSIKKKHFWGKTLFCLSQ